MKGKWFGGRESVENEPGEDRSYVSWTSSINKYIHSPVIQPESKHKQFMSELQDAFTLYIWLHWNI